MPYRDGLRARLDALLQAHDELRQRRRELEASALQLAALDEDIAALRARIEAERRLPLLDEAKIASPCDARWEDMAGDDRVRFCTSCQKNVYALAALHRAEAERLLAAEEGVCMRLYRRADGTLLTADCPEGVRRKRRRRVILAAALGMSAGVAGVHLPHDVAVEVVSRQRSGEQLERGESYRAPEIPPGMCQYSLTVGRLRPYKQ